MRSQTCNEINSRCCVWNRSSFNPCKSMIAIHIDATTIPAGAKTHYSMIQIDENEE